MGVKKSNFPGDTVVTSGASFDYFDSGINKQISFTDLVGQLGVTGTIVQDGDPAGTPVLDTQGSVNNIRNLEDGAGIVTQVSAQNGITIKSGIVQDGSGTPLFDDISLQTPTIASLSGGTGISVSKIGNNIQIINDTPANVNPVVVVVTSTADLGTDIGTAYQLDTDTAYEIVGTASNPLVVDKPIIWADNTSFVAPNLNTAVISATTILPFIQATSTLVNITNISIVGPGIGSGTLFAIDNSVGFHFVICEKFLASEFSSLGSIDTGAAAFSMKEWNFFLYTTGLNLNGSGGTIDIMRGGAFLGGGTCFDLGTGDWARLSITNNRNTLPGATFLDGAANGANITNGSIIGEGVYSNNIFNGAGGTEVATITDADSGWVFETNADIPDSTVFGQITAGSFTISGLVLNTPQVVDPATTLGASERTDMPVNGRLRKTGRRPEKVRVKFVMKAQTSSGTNTMNLLVVKNGDDSNPLHENVGIEVKSTTDVAFIVGTFDPLSLEDDYYELWVESTTGTNNIAVATYSAEIFKV